MFRPLVTVFAALVLLSLPQTTFAQTARPTISSRPIASIPPTPTTATAAAQTATPSATPAKTTQEDVTKPEESKEKEEFIALFQRRKVETPDIINITPYIVQYSVKSGVPANTVILILLLPILATLIAFLRHVVGIPSLELILPIALSITLLATGITTGLVLLMTILVASTFARFILKRVRIMQLPKLALSIFVVAIFVFLSLTASATYGTLSVKQISIFPILLLILLSERIVALQIERNNRETLTITSATIALAILGFFLLSNSYIRDFVLLYPESVFLLVPVNLAIGRYFGLRVTEYFRFSPLIHHGSKH